MLRSAASKVMWVGRATIFLVGLAVILALLFGVVSTALAHGGDKGFFHLGHRNVSGAVSTLVKKGAGPALNLQVGSGPPLKVNSSKKVTNLNADKLDGKHASALVPSKRYMKADTGSRSSAGVSILGISCDEGDVVLSGGAELSNPNEDFLVDSGPVLSQFNLGPPIEVEGWQAGFRNTGSTDSLTVYILCADYPPLHTEPNPVR